MADLILTDPTLVLAAASERFVLRRGDVVTRQVRAQGLDLVVLVGAVGMTAGARSLALRGGLDVVFLDGKGRFRGRLSGPASPNGVLRIAQAAFLLDDLERGALAADIVAGKIANQRAVLLRVQRYRRDTDIAACLARLRHLQRRTAAAATAPAPNVERIRGLEGDAAAVYFDGFGRAISNPDFSFETRTRRPPRDPIDACLSFGYTLLTLRVESAVRQVGLEPAIGALHEPTERRASLVLDLVEEFRAPVIDRLVLRLINRRQMGPADFEHPDGAARRDAVLSELGPAGEEGEEPEPDREPPAVHLSDTGRRVFLRALAGALSERLVDPTSGNRMAVRQLMVAQARQLARVFRGRQKRYVPIATR